MAINFTTNYIKCPKCKNILALSFIGKTCPNPLCGFDFAGLEAYLNKDDQELRKILLSENKAKKSRKYGLAVTAIKYNMGNYLVHFIECGWSAHYNTLYNDFIVNFLDDLNILKKVLKSKVIKDKDNVVVSKNGYKMFWDLFCRLKKIKFNVDFENFLTGEFPAFHRRHYDAWFLKWEKEKKDIIRRHAKKAKLMSNSS